MRPIDKREVAVCDQYSLLHKRFPTDSTINSSKRAGNIVEMERLKDSLTKKIQNLGDSFTSAEEDAMMDDMSEFIVSPYTGGKSMEGEESTKKKGIINCPPSSSTNESDVIDNIDAIYFVEEGFDAIDYELRKHFEPQLNIHDLEEERLRLRSQLQVVSKKISELIIEKSPSYSKQMEDVDVIREDLSSLLKDVATIRRALFLAKKRSGAALGILANEKKKRLLNRLRNTLLSLKTLYETEFQLKDAVAEGHFPLAIRICIEAKEAATTYRHFSCVSDLMCKLVGATELIENELDASLARLTLSFDVDLYSYIQQAYSMLNQREVAAKKLVLHFQNSLERSARTVVADKILTETSEWSYGSLCQALPSDSVPTTVREMCFVLTKILLVFHSTLRFHSEEFERCQSEQNGSPCSVLSFLSSSAFPIFRSALSSVNILLCCVDFSYLKFDQIMEIVDLITRFCVFGREHFGHSAVELTLALTKQSLSYFDRYHSERMNELKMFLENETFTLCPVPHQFTIFDLQDFHFLKTVREQKESTPPLESPGEQLDFQMVPVDFVNPFGKEELKSRRVSERSNRTSTAEEGIMDEPEDHVPPNLCNTALNLLRFFGRYLRMTSLLPSVAEKSIPGIISLFNFFFISICKLFGEDGAENMEKEERLQLILEDLSSSTTSEDLPLPALCCAVNLTFPDKLFGIAERIVAAESLEFVARQLDLVRPVIEGILNDSLSLLDNFYSQILPLVPLARMRVFDAVASRCLKFDILQQKISSEKWEIDELRSQHSEYVDFLIQDVSNVVFRLDDVAKNINVTEGSRRLLLDRILFYAFRAIVQGYCEAGRCSTEGRALMQLDLQHLILKLEQHIKPVPHTAFVEGYIKAFYLPESGLEQWIGQHTEYTSKQLVSLLSVANHVSKKAKTRIINALVD